jgi:MFS family permease
MVAGVLGALTLAHVTSPAILLVMTFALGIGAALGMPAFAALTPQRVPREQLVGVVSGGWVRYTQFNDGEKPADSTGQA